MICINETIPFSNEVINHEYSSSNIAATICSTNTDNNCNKTDNDNDNNYIDIRNFTIISSKLHTITPPRSFYNIYKGYLKDTNNKETDIMMLEHISCVNYFPTFNHISNKIELKSHIDNKIKKNECCICLGEQTLSDMVITKCGHLFCRRDMVEVFSENMNNSHSDKIYCSINCPLCRETLEDRDIFNLSKSNKMCNYVKQNHLDYKTNEIYRRLTKLKKKTPNEPVLHIIIGNTNRWLNSITNLIKSMKFHKNIVIKPLIWKYKFNLNTINNIKDECFNGIKYNKIEYHIMSSSYRGDFYEQNYYKNLSCVIYFFNNIYRRKNRPQFDLSLSTIMQKISNTNKTFTNLEKLDSMFNFYVIKNTIDEKIFKSEIKFINHFKK